MALSNAMPPPARQMFDHASALEMFLCSAERATAPDSSDVVDSNNGAVINLGWLRQLAYDVRKVAQYLESQEPQAPVTLNSGQSISTPNGGYMAQDTPHL